MRSPASKRPAVTGASVPAQLAPMMVSTIQAHDALHQGSPPICRPNEEIEMTKKTLLIGALATAMAGAFSAPAFACDPVPGMLIGGGIGAAIGNAPGAAVGAILGSVIAGSAPCYAERPYHARRYE